MIMKRYGIFLLPALLAVGSLAAKAPEYRQVQARENARKTAVSYTHLTLPTSAYV